MTDLYDHKRTYIHHIIQIRDKGNHKNIFLRTLKMFHYNNISQLPLLNCNSTATKPQAVISSPHFNGACRQFHVGGTGGWLGKMCLLESTDTLPVKSLTCLIELVSQLQNVLIERNVIEYYCRYIQCK